MKIMLLKWRAVSIIYLKTMKLFSACRKIMQPMKLKKANDFEISNQQAKIKNWFRFEFNKINNRFMSQDNMV